MVLEKLKCRCIYPYQFLIEGELYEVLRCSDGYYRVKGLALNEFDFSSLFEIIKD